MENQNQRAFVDFIISEFRQIQAELMIEKAIASEVDEKIDALVNQDPKGLTGILSEIVLFHQLNKEKQDLLIKLKYLDGKFDALKSILEYFEKNLEN